LVLPSFVPGLSGDTFIGLGEAGFSGDARRAALLVIYVRCHLGEGLVHESPHLFEDLGSGYPLG
jgi:hypothetical protein